MPSNDFYFFFPPSKKRCEHACPPSFSKKKINQSAKPQAPSQQPPTMAAVPVPRSRSTDPAAAAGTGPEGPAGGIAAPPPPRRRTSSAPGAAGPGHGRRCPYPPSRRARPPQAPAAPAPLPRPRPPLTDELLVNTQGKAGHLRGRPSDRLGICNGARTTAARRRRRDWDKMAAAARGVARGGRGTRPPSLAPPAAWRGLGPGWGRAAPPRGAPLRTLPFLQHALLRRSP